MSYVPPYAQSGNQNQNKPAYLSGINTSPSRGAPPNRGGPPRGAPNRGGPPRGRGGGPSPGSTNPPPRGNTPPRGMPSNRGSPVSSAAIYSSAPVTNAYNAPPSNQAIHTSSLQYNSSQSSLNIESPT